MYSFSLNISFPDFTPAAVETDVRLKMNWHSILLRARCAKKRGWKQGKGGGKINLIFWGQDRYKNYKKKTQIKRQAKTVMS